MAVPEVWDPNYHSLDLLAYSPDGCSLASYFGSTITIWDIQTGGVVEEIEYKAISALPKCLVWLLDGTICAIFPVGEETWAIVTYDVASGKETSTGTFPSLVEPCIWPHNNSLWIMVMLDKEDSQIAIDILEIWPTFIDNPINSFSIKLNIHDKPPTISFSPFAYRLSTLTDGHCGPDTLFVFDIQNSVILLQEKDYFTANCLSPDGSLLVASGMCDGDYVWKYTSNQSYTLWRRFPFWGGPGNIPRGYQFSPTSSSMLISRVDSLEVQHFEEPATNSLMIDPPTQTAHPYNKFSATGTYVVTAPKFGQMITITNLYNNSSQFINTEFPIHGIALTGNILLVEGDYELVGWRLTAEGVVDKVFNDGREGHDNRLWTEVVQKSFARFWVEGQVGVIEVSEHLLYYNTETGGKLESILVEVPPPSSPFWVCPSNHNLGFVGQYSFSYHDFIECNDLSEDDLVSMPWYEEGWILYPEGEHQHRFWLPALWRSGWYEAHWLGDVATLRLNAESGLIIIKL